MIRGCLLVTAATLLAGCSLLLDFSDNAIPKDATPDLPFNQAECDYKEPNDSADTAPAIDPAVDMGPGAICPGAVDDHDFYKFTVPASIATVVVKIIFTNSASGDLDLRLYDKTGASVLSRSSGFGDEETITCPGASPSCPMLAADDYVFEVFPALSGSVNSYSMQITLTPM